MRRIRTPCGVINIEKRRKPGRISIAQHPSLTSALRKTGVNAAHKLLDDVFRGGRALYRCFIKKYASKKPLRNRSLPESRLLAFKALTEIYGDADCPKTVRRWFVNGSAGCGKSMLGDGNSYRAWRDGV